MRSLFFEKRWFFGFLCPVHNNICEEEGGQKSLPLIDFETDITQKTNPFGS